jgi:nucleoside-diphosphate-sugar epimerase
MKNIILTGCAGMVGSLALIHCLNREGVNKVTVVIKAYVSSLFLYPSRNVAEFNFY